MIWEKNLPALLMSITKRRAVYTRGLMQLQHLDQLFRKHCVTHQASDSEVSLSIIGSLFQCGIDGLIVSELPEKLNFRSAYLLQRTEQIDVEVYKQRLFAAQDALRKVVKIENYLQHFGFYEASCFLTDLGLACENKHCVISLMGPPDIGALSQVFEPSFVSIISAFYQSFDLKVGCLPIPTAEVLRSRVEDFHEMVTSDLFSAYQSSHAELKTDASEPSLGRVVSAANRIREKFDRQIDIKRLLLSLLPLGAKLVDTVFGRLPGTLAESLAKSVGNDAGTNLVYYDCSSLWKDMLVKQFAAQHPSGKFMISLSSLEKAKTAA